MSNCSRTLKPAELPHLAQAKEMALQLDYKPWVTWMRANFNYATAVRMCTFIGIKRPCHGSWLRLRNFDIEVT